MDSVNEVILTGTIEETPDIRTTKTGKAVTTINLKVDKAGYVPITCWEKYARLAGTLVPGTTIMVTGELHLDSWEDKTGKKRYQHKVTGVWAVIQQPEYDENTEPMPPDDKADQEEDAPHNEDDLPF